MDKAIIIDHVSYNIFLKDISFTIQKGEFVGIIGPTGSGKTTILNILSGLSKPSSGFVSVLGYDPYLKSYDFLKQITFLTEENQVLKSLPPINALEITKSIYELSDREFNKNLNELTQYIQDPNLLNSLIYKPKILFIDKLGLEVESIYEYNQKNESTVLFSTRRFDDLINLVRRIIIIDRGQILFDGAIDEIVTKFATDKIIKIKLSSVIDPKLVNEIGIVKKYVYPYIYISVPRSIVSFAAAEILQNFPVISLNIEELSIEEIIENMKI